MKRRILWTMGILGVALLTGCTSPDTRAYRTERERIVEDKDIEEDIDDEKDYDGDTDRDDDTDRPELPYGDSAMALEELLLDKLDQSVIKYNSKYYDEYRGGIWTYNMKLIDFDDKKMSEEIKKIKETVDEYMQSDFEGQAIYVVISADNDFAGSGSSNLIHMTNYTSEKNGSGYDIVTIDDHMSHVTFSGIDEMVSLATDEDYTINHIEYWEEIGIEDYTGPYGDAFSSGCGAEELIKGIFDEVDQSVIKYGGCYMSKDCDMVVYYVSIIDFDDEKMADAMGDLCDVVNGYLQSDAYEGEAICVHVRTESSLCCVSYETVAYIQNNHFKTYFGEPLDMGEIYDHISYVNYYGIDDDMELYYFSENTEYTINQQEFWDNFDIDEVEFLDS